MVRENGMTLIELLLTLCLGATIILSVTQCFFVIKQLFMHQRALVELQEAEKELFHILSPAIQSAGSFGCASLDVSLFAHENLSLAALLGDAPIELKRSGFFKKHAFVHPETQARMHKDFPVLWIKQGGKIYQLQEPIDLKKGTLTLQGHAFLAKGTWVALSDCSNIVFFQLQEDVLYHPLEQTTQIVFSPFKRRMPHLQKTAQIMALKSTLYYIGHTGRNTLSGKPLYALYAKTLGHPSEELIEGVVAWRWEVADKHNLKLFYAPLENPSQAIFGLKGSIIHHSLSPSFAESKWQSLDGGAFKDRAQFAQMMLVGFRQGWA